MLKYPISTLLYIAKINIKDTIQDILKLHNNIDVKLTIIVKDKDGKIIKQHKQRSHSFVSNFVSILATLMLNPYNTYNNAYPIKDLSGTTQSLNAINESADEVLTMLDNANDSTYGIVVGTGTATPTPQDYKLENQIQNGTGSGQLSYGTHSISPTPTNLSISNNTILFQVSRTFQNQSGASIIVSEVGIIAETNISTSSASGTNDYVLIIHDLLSSPITIPNNAVLTIVYTISVTT